MPAALLVLRGNRRHFRPREAAFGIGAERHVEREGLFHQSLDFGRDDRNHVFFDLEQQFVMHLQQERTSRAARLL